MNGAWRIRCHADGCGLEYVQTTAKAPSICGACGSPKITAESWVIVSPNWLASKPEHPRGRCGRGEAAGAAGLCAACDAEADAAELADAAEAALRRVRVEPASLYAALLAAGCEMDSHESDLYVRATAEAAGVFKRFPTEWKNARAFTSDVDGRLWYDVPFAFLPWWELRAPARAAGLSALTLEASQAGVATPVVQLTADEREALRTALEKALDAEGGVL